MHFQILPKHYVPGGTPLEHALRELCPDATIVDYGSAVALDNDIIPIEPRNLRFNNPRTNNVFLNLKEVTLGK